MGEGDIRSLMGSFRQYRFDISREKPPKAATFKIHTILAVMAVRHVKSCYASGRNAQIPLQNPWVQPALGDSYCNEFKIIQIGLTDCAGVLVDYKLCAWTGAEFKYEIFSAKPNFNNICQDHSPLARTGHSGYQTLFSLCVNGRSLHARVFVRNLGFFRASYKISSFQLFRVICTCIRQKRRLPTPPTLFSTFVFQ